jgi:putative acetyltransferase
MELIIRNEQPDDIPLIHKVNAAAFDTSAEAGLVDALRENNAILLSLVAVLNQTLVGHILLSPVVLESKDSKLHDV